MKTSFSHVLAAILLREPFSLFRTNRYIFKLYLSYNSSVYSYIDQIHYCIIRYLSSKTV
jgi:hypothetical protein